MFRMNAHDRHTYIGAIPLSHSNNIHTKFGLREHYPDEQWEAITLFHLNESCTTYLECNDVCVPHTSLHAFYYNHQYTSIVNWGTCFVPTNDTQCGLVSVGLN